MFDPKAECVAAAQHRKKKATGSSGRPSNVVVFMLPKFTSNVPRSKHRAQLETTGRRKTLKFSRNMSNEQVELVIRQGFGVGTHFKYLDCIDNELHISEEQEPDDSIIVSRKSAVYLMEATENVQVHYTCGCLCACACVCAVHMHMCVCVHVCVCGHTSLLEV